MGVSFHGPGDWSTGVKPRASAGISCAGDWKRQARAKGKTSAFRARHGRDHERKSLIHFEHQIAGFDFKGFDPLQKSSISRVTRPILKEIAAF